GRADVAGRGLTGRAAFAGRGLTAGGLTAGGLTVPRFTGLARQPQRPGALPADQLAGMADGIAAARRRLGPRPQVDSVLDQREPLADFPGGVVPDQPPAQPLRGLLEFGPPVLPMRQEHPRPRGDALGHELFGPDDVDGRSPDRRRLDGSPLE